jgi:predicted enzyme related to lactoylglutathione lyase
MPGPRMRLSGPVVDAADAIALASFYEHLLGWTMTDSAEGPHGGWAKIRSPDGNLKIEFQGSEGYRAPVWPSVPGEQQMMIHLDIAVEDLEQGVTHAVDLGARVAEHQPQSGVRVMLDPEGHPFCLFPGAV